MLEFGYVRLYRSLLNWEWYTDTNTKIVFLHLILTANWEPKKWRGITIERGQRVYSRASLAQELRLSERNIRTAINHLISTGEVTNKSTPQYSILTIKNYDEYQQVTGEATSDRPTGDQLPTNDRPQLKKDKNDKNDNKLNSGTSATRPKKHKYGEYRNVLLSDSDIEKLKAKFGDWKERIEILSKGIELKGYKYRNHYLAILKWAERDPQSKTKKATTYDIDEYERATGYSNFDMFTEDGK